MEKRDELVWNTLERFHFEKEKEWYYLIAIAGFTLTVVTYFISGGSIPLVIVFVLATVIILLKGSQKPDVYEIRITPKGVAYGEEFFPYENIKSFSLEEERDPQSLHLKIGSIIQPEIIIYLDNYGPAEIRDYLLDYLDEEYHRPSFSEDFMHFLGM